MVPSRSLSLPAMAPSRSLSLPAIRAGVSEQESNGESVDESAVWKFSEANGEQRSV